MRVIRLKTDGFRNLQGGVLEADEGVTLLCGDNAQGKTNLLEAIWLFTGGRSFRGAKDKEMIAFDRDRAELSLAFYADGREQTADIRIEHRRTATLNGVSQPSATALAGRFCAVVFSPAHLTLIKGGPEQRRRFLDAACGQLWPAYIPALTDYVHALAQRNALIKDCRFHPDCYDLLDAWDAKLAESGARVMTVRARYLEHLLPFSADIYGGLSSGKEQLGLAMQTGGLYHGTDTAAAVGSLLNALRASRSADVAAGFTTVGPHRADLEVTINGTPARAFGSQGQQRSAVLALKLAEAAVLRQVTGEQPVVLLDDVMSELDASRQDYIYNHIRDGQVFVTCCEPSAVWRSRRGKKYFVHAGTWRDMGEENPVKTP